MNRRGFLQFLSAAPVAIAAAVPALIASTRFATGGFVGGHVDLGVCGETFFPTSGEVPGIIDIKSMIRAMTDKHLKSGAVALNASVSDQMKAHDLFCD